MTTINLTTRLKYTLMALVCVITGPTHASCPNDPVMIDLGQDGIHLGKKGIGIYFDLMATGTPVQMQWVAPDGNDAFLVLDKNANGIVDNGAELFTNYGYLVIENRTAQNGFVELGQYDHIMFGGNNDGYISAADQIWQSLSLWLDGNADGISTADEMIDLKQSSLTRLSVVPNVNNGRVDSAGNRIPLWSWAYNENGTGNIKYQMFDVFFKGLTTVQP